MEIEVAGRTIVLDERPRHRAVKNARNIMRDFTLRNISLKDAQPNEELGDIIQRSVERDGDMAIKMADLNESLNEYQTIILATGMSYVQLSNMVEDMYEDEYTLLLEKSIEVLGGDAQYFFENSGTCSISKQTQKNQPPSESRTSENHVNSSSSTSEKPSKAGR